MRLLQEFKHFLNTIGDVAGVTSGEINSWNFEGHAFIGVSDLTLHVICVINMWGPFCVCRPRSVKFIVM